jgi:hypothetical protein
MACTEAIRIIFERPHEEKELIMSSGDSLNPTDFIHITRFVPRTEPSTADGASGTTTEPPVCFIH